MKDGRDKALQKHREAQKTIKTLKIEVCRKDHLVAEKTSLLVLSQKLEALYAGTPDNEDN